MFSFLGDAVGAAYHIVSALALVLSPMPWGLATVAAIVLFTIGVRLLLLPLSYYALRGQAAQARLGGQIQALRSRYASQPDRLQREVTALYQREGTGMLAGCLPVLLQLPLLSVMYTMFRSADIGGRANALLGHDLLGAPLGSHWLSGPGPLSAQGAVFLGLLALLAGAAWLAARAARRSAATLSPQVAAQPGGTMSVLARVLPYSTLVVAAVMPLAAGIYLLTTTAWAAAERTVLGRRALPPGPPVPPGGPQAEAAAGRRDRVRHDERSTGGEGTHAPAASPARRHRGSRSRRAHQRRGAATVREDPADPVRELRVARRARGLGDRADEQVLGRVPRPPVLRGPAGHRPA
jgi:YidC/Oxa1 family membrane protein insertase